MDHPNDVENIDFEAEFEWLMIADIEDADADTMLRQHEDQMLVSTDNVDLDGMTVPMPPLPPPDEVATPVANDSTYIQDMFDLELLIQGDKQPKAQQNDNTKENDAIDNETQDNDVEIFTLEDIMNH